MSLVAGPESGFAALESDNEAIRSGMRTQRRAEAGKEVLFNARAFGRYLPIDFLKQCVGVCAVATIGNANTVTLATGDSPAHVVSQPSGEVATANQRFFGDQFAVLLHP